MRVQILNFPTGYNPEAEEVFRDKVADSMSQALMKLKVKREPVSVSVNFDGIHQGPEDVKGQRNSTESAKDFSSLLNPPRDNSRLLQIPPATYELISNAVKRYEVAETVYKSWGISKIDPIPRYSLNFIGPPGTGKTLAAHYIAFSLGKRILEISYADIVSKYFGEAAQNLAELYRFAEQSDAVLFIDEAETLLSRRSVSQDSGADHATNSLKSQLLILIEKTPILSIFSSNLVSSYDQAFISRLISVPFEMPDYALRLKIWEAHIPSNLPIADDVSVHDLAATFPDLNGRQISRSIIEAAFRAAINDRESITLEDFKWAISSVIQIQDLSNQP